MNDLVSIVIPVYNRVDVLIEAVSSAIAQTYPRVEILVIDDGSDKADVAKVVADFPRDRVRYFRQENAGPCSARNHGLRVARGRWICFLDSDDLLLPNFVSEQIDYLSDHPRTDVVCTNAQFFGTTDEIVNAGLFGSGDCLIQYIDLLKGAQIPGIHTGIISREALERAGPFDEGIRFCEDIELWLRLARHAPIAYRDVIGVRTRSHDGQRSHSVDAMDRDYREILSRQRDFKLSPEEFAAIAGRLAYLDILGAWAAGRAAQARSVLSHSPEVRPLLPGPYGLFYLLTFLPFRWVEYCRHRNLNRRATKQLRRHV